MNNINSLQESAVELLLKLARKRISITRRRLSDKIDIRVLRALNDSIMTTQVNGEEALYFSGKSIGEELVRNYEKELKNMKEILRFIRHLFKGLMLGIVEFEVKEKRVIIRVDECAFCKRRKEPPIDIKNKCNFLTGFISGIITKASNQQCAGKELYCRNNGDPYCVFEINFPEGKSHLIPIRFIEGKFPIPTSKFVKRG